MDETTKIIEKDGIYSCPVCRSKKITLNTQAVLMKYEDANTGKEIDKYKNKIRKLSNREKAAAYDMASTEGAGCWHYSCRKCGWNSEVYVE